MTTVIYDGRYLAADTLIAGETTKFGTSQKIFLQPGFAAEKLVIAWSGPAMLPQYIENKLQKDPDIKGYRLPPVDKAEGYCVLIITDLGGICEFTPFSEYPQIYSSKLMAMGTGADFALGARMAGASVKHAIEIASLWDMKTNSDVVVFDTQTWSFIQE